jgi:hypothetical protein
MAVKWNTIKVGDALWMRFRRNVGNTTMKETVSFKVDVLELNLQSRQAKVKWNGNGPEWWPQYRMLRLFRTPAKNDNPFRRSPADAKP